MPKVYNLLSLDIAEFLQQYIEEKKLMPGDKLPSERELAITLSVTRTTLRHGLEILVGKGIKYRVHGSGYYICKPKVNREFTHYCFPCQDSLLMEREYNVLPIEYIPTSLAQIAQNLFSPLTLSELRSISYVELVDDIPISLMYTFQDSESEHLLPDLPFSKTLPEDTYFTQTIRVFPESFGENESLIELLNLTADDSLLLISTFIHHAERIHALCLSICVGARVNLISDVKLP